MNYQICLLTNPDAVLDHNAYLGAKINLSVMIGLLLSVFLVTVIALAKSCNKKTFEIARGREQNVELSRMIEKLNDELSLKNLYDARLAVFGMEFLPMLFEKLENKGVLPITLLLLEYDTDRAASFFLEDSYLIADQRILRFRDEKAKRLVLVTVGYDREEAVEAIEWLLYQEVRLIGMVCLDEESELSLDEALNELNEMGENEDGR